jgi:hypothetical protein
MPEVVSSPSKYTNVPKPSPLACNDFWPWPLPATLRLGCSHEMLRRIALITLSLQHLPQAYLQPGIEASVAAAAHRIVSLLALLAPRDTVLQLQPSAGDLEPTSVSRQGSTVYTKLCNVPSFWPKPVEAWLRVCLNAESTEGNTGT